MRKFTKCLFFLFWIWTFCVWQVLAETTNSFIGIWDWKKLRMMLWSNVSLPAHGEYRFHGSCVCLGPIDSQFFFFFFCLLIPYNVYPVLLLLFFFFYISVYMRLYFWCLAVGSPMESQYYHSFNFHAMHRMTYMWRYVFAIIVCLHAHSLRSKSIHPTNYSKSNIDNPNINANAME